MADTVGVHEGVDSAIGVPRDAARMAAGLARPPAGVGVEAHHLSTRIGERAAVAERVVSMTEREAAVVVTQHFGFQHAPLVVRVRPGIAAGA